MAPEQDPEPPENGEAQEEARREPVYPMGPTLRVEREEVQLTFLDPELLKPPASAGEGDEDEEQGIEIKSPLGVRLPVFEGPLDLLYYLIRRDELDIYDIPIGHMTEQYLGMLQVMKVLDLEVAGDFLVMAATLMRIKARMLLPTWPEGEEDEDDPRAELVRQLLEYRRFKEAARRLKEHEEERRHWFGRGFVPVFEGELPSDLEPVSHFALIDVMKDVLARVGEEFLYEVELEDVSLEEKCDLVLAELRAEGRALFVDLVTRYPRRLHVVVTFMAILELAKQGDLVIAQEATFGQIWVYRVEEGRIAGASAEPADPGAPETPPTGPATAEPRPEPDPGAMKTEPDRAEDPDATT